MQHASCFFFFARDDVRSLTFFQRKQAKWLLLLHMQQPSVWEWSHVFVVCIRWIRIFWLVGEVTFFFMFQRVMFSLSVRCCLLYYLTGKHYFCLCLCERLFSVPPNAIAVQLSHYSDFGVLLHCLRLPWTTLFPMCVCMSLFNLM